MQLSYLKDLRALGCPILQKSSPNKSGFRIEVIDYVNMASDFFHIFKMFFFFVRPQVPENHVFPALHRLKKCMCGKKIVPEFGIIIMIYHYNLSIYNFYTGHRIFKVKNFTRGRGFCM